MDALLHVPALTPAEAVDVARRLYGIDAGATPLPGERDQNFLLQTPAGDRFVLKIANGTDNRALLEAQNAAMVHVARRSPLCPRPVAALDGSLLTQMTATSGPRHFVRVLTWIKGEPLATQDRRHRAGHFEELGERIGELDVALDGFDDPALHRQFYWDLAGGQTLLRERTSLIEDLGMRALVMQVASAIEARDAPRLGRLRRAAAHNDPNDHNILVDGSAITGILDFGDIVHTYAIADLAIAIAYAILEVPDPVAAAAAVVRGYHRVRPVDEDEIAVLFGLVLLRLCMSVVIAARQQSQRPDDPYLGVSQGPIARSLPSLAALDRDIVDAELRAARGRTPQETLEARKRVIGSNVTVSYRHPLKIVRGWMQFLYDQSGRRYLDAFNNVPHVGHSHPRVVQAAIEQMLVLNTNT
ncbi:MAG TPA: phosphotransferase, partial [Vicinamibacterales bacterium]